MTSQEAIMAFSQSEKIKAGLIWVSQSLEMLRYFSEPERKGGEKVIRTILGMVLHDLELAKKVAQDAGWEKAEAAMEQAIVMMDSGVAPDAVSHLTKALSQVTGIGQRSMTSLLEEGLL
jgi:hypothetical protein